MMFGAHIGIDYSGAETAEARLRGLRIYIGRDGGCPQRETPAKPGAVNWTRREVYQYCADAVMGDRPVIIGIDHAFGFPASYMERYDIKSWDCFLDDFASHWPTMKENTTVECLRPGNCRTGRAAELRLCETWTAGAKSVFWFDVNGSVAKSTHAGIPWLHRLRRCPATRDLVHWWPFDGFAVPDSKSVVAEVFPSIFRRRYARECRTTDEHDAYATARWLGEMDQRGLLPGYFNPPLLDRETTIAAREGWILGVA